MFKPVALATGVLTSSMSDSSNVVMVNADLYNRLVAVLGTLGADHTYLEIGNSAYGEVVKVTSVTGGVVTLARAQDGTMARGFATLTPVNYIFCASAVQDIIASTIAPNVTIVGPAWLGITQVGYAFTFAPVVGFNSSNGSVNVNGSFPNYDLTVNPVSLGLCSMPVVGG